MTLKDKDKDHKDNKDNNNNIKINQHSGVITDIAYDYYGKELATCSTDNTIKLWEKDEKNNWISYVSIQSHDGAVNRLSWAHPEYGKVLASCSLDCSVVVYEVQNEYNSKKKKLEQRCKLVDSRQAVTDVKFAPHFLGLILARCSQDGYVKIYNAPNITDLTIFNAYGEFQTDTSNCSCLDWNPSPFDPPMLAVGSNKSTKIWEYNEEKKKWFEIVELKGHEDIIRDVAWAPHMGRSYHLLATACKDKCVRIWKIPSDWKDIKDIKPIVLKQKTEVWRVSWNVTGTMLAATTDDGTVNLFKKNFMKNEWTCIKKITDKVKDK